MLSVVIPALNSETTIDHTLSSVFANNLQSEEFEVVVVDNGSTDDTMKAARKYPVKLLSCPKRGQGAARNVGITHSKGEIICFTDSDIIVPRNWFQRITASFTQCPKIDGVGGASPSPQDWLSE